MQHDHSYYSVNTSEMLFYQLKPDVGCQNLVLLILKIKHTRKQTSSSNAIKRLRSTLNVREIASYFTGYLRTGWNSWLTWAQEEIENVDHLISLFYCLYFFTVKCVFDYFLDLSWTFDEKSSVIWAGVMASGVFLGQAFRNSKKQSLQITNATGSVPVKSAWSWVANCS